MIRARHAWLLAILGGCASKDPPTTVDAAAPTDVPVAADVVDAPAPADAPDVAAPADVPADVAADVAALPPRDVVVATDVVLEEADAGPPADALDPLPAHAAQRSGRFDSVDRCATCHAAAPNVFRDAMNRDVSPSGLWRGSAHAIAARDPYWLAVVAQEMEATPPARATIEQVCTRCHAPAGNVATADAMRQIHYEDITAGTTPEAHLAREGVTCSACHQITSERLGTPESFNGGYVVGTGRQTFGPHANPVTAPEMTALGYTPTQGAHMTGAALCGTCHTLITRALNAAGEVVGPEFPEQACYLEWRNSAYRNEGTPGSAPVSCQGCHMPRRDQDGVAINTLISSQGDGLMPRTPIGRHVFMGANGYMLEMLAAERGWVNGVSTREDLEAGAGFADGNLRRAVTLTVEGAQRAEGSLSFNVRLTNAAGHRFPTGYPSRRAWIHVRVLDAAGSVRFESGRTDANGRFVDGLGRSLEPRRDIVRPHLREVTAEDQVQVYESVPVDVAGAVTHLPLRAATYVKDNRLLPRGWTAEHPDARYTSPVGVTGDADFRAGEDVVRFAFPTTGWVPARIEAEVLFQSISPDAAFAASQRSIPAGARFRAMVASHPPLPRTVATANATVR